MKDLFVGLGFLGLAFAMHFYPAPLTCVAVGAWYDVDPYCKGAIKAQETYDFLGFSSADDIKAYYTLVDTNRQLTKVFRFISLIKIDDEMRKNAHNP